MSGYVVLAVQDEDNTSTAAPRAVRNAGGAAFAYAATLNAGEDQSRDVQVVSPEWNYSVINATGATTVRSVATNGGVTYGGYKILGNAGVLTMTIYDNTAASGQLLEPSGISVAAASEKLYATGVRCQTGVTVNLSGDPTDGLILILWK
jgi:hypothetical protein